LPNYLNTDLRSRFFEEVYPMQVFLEAIKFNHDQSSATGDAFNIRRNDTEQVNVPEWRRGISVKPEDSPAAYAIRETRAPPWHA
jgi:hypothetical protein